MDNWKRTFAIIWSGQFISQLTSSIVGYAVVFWLSLETKSPEVLAFAVLAWSLPQIVLGLFAGVYIDRWDRKRVMIVSDMFIALCTFLLFVLLLAGSMELSYFYILFACRGVGGAFHSPAFQASIPLLAPEQELTRISGINQSIQSVCNIIAPVIGATLIAFTRIEYILLLDVAGAVIACASLLFVTIRSPLKTATENRMYREIRECFSIIRSTKGMTPLFFCFTLVTFVITPVAILFPFITIDHFNGGSFQMGLIETIWGLGALGGGLLVAGKLLRTNAIILINAMYVVLGIYLIVSGMLPPHGFIIFAALTIAGGISYTIANALFVAVIQRNIAPSILGRVFSVFFSLSMMPSVIGIAASGFLAEEIGITAVFISGGIIIIFIGIGGYFINSMLGLGKTHMQ